MLKKNGAAGMGNGQNMQKESSNPEKHGIDDGVALVKKDEVAASSSKSNEKVSNLNAAGANEDVGKRSYADKVNATGNNVTNVGNATSSNNKKEDDEEDVEMVFDETVGFMESENLPTNKGASTPSVEVSNDPLNVQLCDEEARCLLQFNQASLDEERFLKQKAKIHWLAVGDGNNSYFHNSLKCKTHCNRVDRVTDANGLMHEGGDVPMAFVNHFEQFLGADYSVSMPVSPDLFVNRLDEDAAVNMIRPVTEITVQGLQYHCGAYGEKNIELDE
ncbi:hypothetical protein QVD17_24376 [Tagetes erecta]|uniref:Uncharacterized protein n=1 Tax=Tagetes erecta TaxID=13708 RepID=A0AAD8KLH3_TARER|nr:hypothetical protein QVD17_24376 [Tagetes erecta]